MPLPRNRDHSGHGLCSGKFLFIFFYFKIKRKFLKWKYVHFEMLQATLLVRFRTQKSQIYWLTKYVQVTSRQFVGSPIHCMTDSMSSGVMDSYCWLHSTFSVSNNVAGNALTDWLTDQLTSLGFSIAPCLLAQPFTWWIINSNRDGFTFCIGSHWFGTPWTISRPPWNPLDYHRGSPHDRGKWHSYYPPYYVTLLCQIWIGCILHTAVSYINLCTPIYFYRTTQFNEN